jgi:hypothetical protein
VIEWYDALLPERAADMVAREAYGHALSGVGRQLEAEDVFRQMHNHEPDSYYWLYHMGIQAALAGDREGALAIEARLAAQGALASGIRKAEYISGRACVAAALGERMRAVQLFQEAHRSGWGWFMDLHWTPALESLWGSDFAPYEEFMRPKG